MRFRIHKPSLPKEMKERLEACPWDTGQLEDVCEEYTRRYEGFWRRVNADVNHDLLAGFLAWRLFTCRDEVELKGKQIRDTILLCLYVLGYRD